MPKSKTRRRKNRTSGRGPSGQPAIAPKHDLAYLRDLSSNALQLVAQQNHELHDLNGFVIGSDVAPEHRSAEIGRTLAEQQVKPDTLSECGPEGHQRQAWNIMRYLQKDAQPCSKCGKTPEFVDTQSGAPELGFRCEEVTEDIEPEAYAIHELYQSGETDLRFSFRSEIKRLEWPEKGSTTMTHLPYPGDDADTVPWLVNELTARGNITADGQVTSPDHGTSFTDGTLHKYLESARKEWFSFPNVLADIERGPVDDDEAE